MKGLLKKTYGMAQALLLVGFGLTAIGCAKGGSGMQFAADGSQTTKVVDEASVNGIVSKTSNVSRKNPHTCRQTSEKCFSETFEQPIVQTGKVDVLFVVQTSDSIQPQRELISTQVQAFIESLPPTADFNIAVMLSHGSTSSLSGRLYRVESEPIVLKSTELANADIRTFLSQKLTQVVLDADAGGGEEGMFSLFNGITTPALLAESQGLGFFREDAALGVVFIADRRDICAIVPVGVPEETDSGKIAARIRDCEGLTAAGLTNRLALLKGAQAVQVSGILYADEPAPAGKELGYGYLDVIALNAGVAIDIANDNIADGLASIAELAGQQMGGQTEFVLTHENIDPKKIIVTVNGVGATYTLNGNVVTITSEIPAGATVVISYCLKAKPKCHGKHHNHRKCRKNQWWKKCPKFGANHCHGKGHGPGHSHGKGHDVGHTHGRAGMNFHTW